VVHFIFIILIGWYFAVISLSNCLEIDVILPIMKK